MTQGQKVVCINDAFNAHIRAVYKALPVQGQVYVVRQVYLGRSKLKPKVRGESDGEVGLLLVGVENPPDPWHADACELGFSSERFRPLEEARNTSKTNVDSFTLIPSFACQQ